MRPGILLTFIMALFAVSCMPMKRYDIDLDQAVITQQMPIGMGRGVVIQVHDHRAAEQKDYIETNMVESLSTGISQAFSNRGYLIHSLSEPNTRFVQVGIEELSYTTEYTFPQLRQGLAKAKLSILVQNGPDKYFQHYQAQTKWNYFAAQLPEEKALSELSSMVNSVLDKMLADKQIYRLLNQKTIA